VSKRIAGVVAAALCAVVVLSGCNSKIGAAAVVGGHTISETKLSGLVDVNAKPFTPQGSAQVVPKAFVLQTLIVSQLFSEELDRAGLTPTAAQLQTASDTALAGETIADVTKALTGYGFDKSFVPIYTKSQALAQVLSAKATADTKVGQQATDFLKNYPVNVNPRYGKWSGSTLTIGSTPAPDFLSLKK
jgi:hypothetical protein